MNLRAMNMLYESIVKRGSLMVVPSALADSLNAPALMGMAGAAGLAPHRSSADGGESESPTAASAGGEPKERARLPESHGTPWAGPGATVRT
jgi:hypothetical protein